MKVIILGDLHLGARNGSTRFSRYFNQFFTDVLYPYALKENIKHIFQLGDLFDNRTSLSIKAYHNSKSVWFDPLVANDIEMTVLLGNHDIHYRNSLKINSPSLYLAEYSGHINIIDRPTAWAVGDTVFDIIPWVCEENRTEIENFVGRKDRGNILLGHLELSGFPMYRGAPAHGGETTKLFDNYELVLSGHYHTRSQKGNIVYTGIPYEITWSDYADPKGFHVYDTSTKKLEFIENPNHMFYKLTYNNGCPELNLSTIREKTVRVLVTQKADAVQFERFLDSIKLQNPYDLSVVDMLNNTTNGQVDDSISVEDTQAIINSYIDSIETTVEKDGLKQFMSTLYTEAMLTDD